MNVSEEYTAQGYGEATTSNAFCPIKQKSSVRVFSWASADGPNSNTPSELIICPVVIPKQHGLNFISPEGVSEKRRSPDDMDKSFSFDSFHLQNLKSPERSASPTVLRQKRFKPSAFNSAFYAAVVPPNISNLNIGASSPDEFDEIIHFL